MALAKKAKAIRTADEFKGKKAPPLAPLIRSGVWSWDLEGIRAARDAQMVGRFELPAKLAAAFRTDDAMSVAHKNRLAPQRGLPVKMVAASDKGKALKICEEADALYGAKGIGVTKATLANVDSDLANHGVAFAVCTDVTREAGTQVRTDKIVRHWPIEHVRWDSMEQTFKTKVANGPEETITHGDGTWVVFQELETAPWTHACVLDGALVWARHAFGVRDWSKCASVQGNAKVVGTLPEGIPLDSPEAVQFLALLDAVASLESPYGIQPFGSKIDYITNTAATWQLFQEIVRSGETSAARIYLGQDGTIGTNSTAPGIDSSHLFGVRNDIVEGALSAITVGLRTGVLEPWCAQNFGDSTLCPDRVYQMPDPDEDARRASLASRTAAFHADVKAARENGFVVDQTYATALAKDYGIAAPTLAVSAPSGADFYAYEIEGGIVTINEVRARKGLPPMIGGERTVPQAQAAAEATASPATPPGGSPRPVPSAARPALAVQR